MKKLKPFEPYILVKKVEYQDKAGEIILTGMDEKRTNLHVITQVSKAAENRGIKVGDIVVLRGTGYPLFATHLTEDDRYPINPEDRQEIVDPSQIMAGYCEEE